MFPYLKVKFVRWFGSFALLGVLLTLSACSSEIDRIWLESPGWSRAALVGETSFNLDVPIAIADDGEIALITFQDQGSEYVPHLIRVDRQGVIIGEHRINTTISKPGPTQIFWQGESLEFLWTDKQQLFHASIDNVGEFISPPELLSGEAAVGSFETETAPNGDIQLWIGGTRRLPGIYMIQLVESMGEFVQVNADGYHPSAQFDDNGNLHVTWLAYTDEKISPDFYYANYPEGRYQPGQVTRLTEAPIRSDSTLEGPYLALASQRVYLFWNEVVRSGDRTNKGNGFILQFPVGEPEKADARDLILLPVFEIFPYEAGPDSELKIGPQMLIEPGEYPVVSPDAFIVSDATENHIALGVSIQIPDKEGYLVNQLGSLSVYGDGTQGYQILTSTPASSLYPNMTSDQDGFFYLTWIERTLTGGYFVYFASTAPDVSEGLLVLTDGDKSHMFWGTIFGLLKGAVLALLSAPIWLALPALVLALTGKLRGRDDSITRPWSLIVILLSIIAYWIGKTTTFRTVNLIDHVPFSAWIPIIPESLAFPLQIGVPLTIVILALFAARMYARRYGSPSASVFVVAYGVVDSILTMAVYGELIIDSF